MLPDSTGITVWIQPHVCVFAWQAMLARENNTNVNQKRGGSLTTNHQHIHEHKGRSCGRQEPQYNMRLEESSQPELWQYELNHDVTVAQTTPSM